MFNFSLHPAHPFLKPFVRAYAIMELDYTDALINTFMPKTESVLLFHIGIPTASVLIDFTFPNSPQKHYAFQNHQGWLGGMLTEPLKGEIAPKGCYLCVTLTPTGLYHLLKETATVLTNQGFSLDCLGLPCTFADLKEKLYVADSKTQALQLVESELLTYYRALDIPFSVKDMSPVTNYILRRKGIVKVKDLENKFHISGRWLQKQFSDQIGISPKEYARLTRFAAMLSYIKTTPSVILPTLLDEFGYYDQSHLTKDFHQFTAQTPNAFLKTHADILNDIF